MASAPCKDCQDRFSGCHSSCEKYLEFKKKDQEEKEAIREERSRRYAVSAFRKQQVEKALRRHGR